VKMNNYPYYSSSPMVSAPSASAQMVLVQRVAFLLASALILTAGAAAWAAQAQLSPALFMPLAIGTIVCAFAIGAASRSNPALGMVLLYVLSALEGLLIGPMLGAIARGFAQGSMIIGEAASLSAILVAGLGSYAWISNKDFGSLGKALFWALLGLIVVGLIGMFVSMGGFGSLLYALVGTVIFCGFVLYDVSNIKLRYGPQDAVAATVALYLDFLNLFLFLLRILLAFSGGSRRN